MSIAHGGRVVLLFVARPGFLSLFHGRWHVIAESSHWTLPGNILVVGQGGFGHKDPLTPRTCSLQVKIIFRWLSRKSLPLLVEMALGLLDRVSGIFDCMSPPTCRPLRPKRRLRRLRPVFVFTCAEAGECPV